MADLMSGKVSFKELANKYANFIVPTVKLKINGSDVVKQKGFLINHLEVSLSATVASMVVIKIAHQHDVESHSFSDSVKSTFQLGTVVEVELGYLSSTEMVFKGYVEMVGAAVGEDMLYVVTLMDMKRLMMTSGRKNVLYAVPNYSDAVKQLLGAYSKVCSPKIDATDDKLESPVSQNSNDYDFIMGDLISKGKVNREFLVVAGTAYFRKPDPKASPIMKARFGRELTNFQVNFSYREATVKVVGVDEKQQAVEAQASVKGMQKQTALLSPPPVHLFADPHVDSVEKAKTKAEAIARQQMQKSCYGQGAMLGIPEIVPGRYLEVENIDSSLDKVYYITEVKHVFTRERFTTHFEIGGCQG